MIDFIFTIDYELFGNGDGSLEELVYRPAERLRTLFDQRNARFVVFVEAAELEMIDKGKTDDAIGVVKRQVRQFFEAGYEIGLHIHPQWYNAQYRNGAWVMDYREYNLCLQPRDRVIQVIERSISYLRRLLGAPDFTPLAYRAGNWLFQPTRVVARVLAEQGIKIDSSVFKGGLQHQHHMDYRPALRNGYYWAFTDDVNIPSPQGDIIEFPTFTRMVPLWRLLSAKRVGIQRKVPVRSRSAKDKLLRLLDFSRPFHPLKLDFCRMTIDELKLMMDAEIQQDHQNPEPYRPMIGIGHTKDLFDFETVDVFLQYLEKEDIRVTDFGEAYRQVHFMDRTFGEQN